MTFSNRITAFAAMLALALPVSPAAVAYDEICLQNGGAFNAYFEFYIVDRNRDALWDYSPNQRNYIVNVDFSDRNDTAPYDHQVTSLTHSRNRAHSFPSGQTYCISKEYIQQVLGGSMNPGEVFAIRAGAAVGEEEWCHQANNERRWDDDGNAWHRVYNWPEKGGRMDLRVWGSTLNLHCQALETGGSNSGEYMWEGCAQGREGFRKSACYPWRPRINAHSAYDLTADETKSIAYLASVARRGANLDARKNDEYPLHVAIRLNRLDHTKVLLGQGQYLNAGDALDSDRNRARLNWQNGDGASPLLYAAKLNRLEHARALLLNLADANLVNNLGEVPLMMAIRANHAEPGMIDMVNLLIENGANASARDNNGRLLLHEAAHFARADVVRALIAAGSTETYAKDSNDKTALDYVFGDVEGHPAGFETDAEREAAATAYAEIGVILFKDNLSKAVERRDLPRLRELAAHTVRDWADPNITLEGDDVAALLRAYELDWLEAVAVLAPSTGINLETPRASDNRRPLHISVAENHAESVAALLDNGAEIDARAGEGGDTALMIAVRNNHISIGETLIARGADSAPEDSEGKTALDLATLGGHAELELALINAGAPRVATTEDDRAVNQRDDSGRTILHRVSAEGNATRIAAVLAQQPQVNSEDNDGNTPLMLAVRENDNAAVAAAAARLLLEAGASPHRTDENEFSLMYHAATRNQGAVVGALLDYGVSPHRDVNQNGAPPLWYAVWKDAGDVIAVLAKAGADIHQQVNALNYPNDERVYLLPLDYLSHAAFLGNASAVRELLRAGAPVRTPSGRVPLSDDKSAMEHALYMYGSTYASRWQENWRLNDAEREVRRRTDAVLAELSLAGMDWHTPDLRHIGNFSEGYPKFAGLRSAGSTGGLRPNETASVDHIIDFVLRNPTDRAGLTSILHRGPYRPAVAGVGGEFGSPDPNRLNSQGHSAMHRIAQHSLAALRIFFHPYKHNDWEANANLQDSSGKTILHWALEAPSAPAPANGTVAEIVQFLLDQGANYSVADAGGNFAIHTAARNGHVEAFLVLLNNGADPNALNAELKSPLDLAFNDGIRTLLQNALANAQDEDGRTALHRAVSDNPPRVASAIARANVNIRDNDGNTPLMLGIISGEMSEETAKSLLDAGASFAYADKTGNLPLHAAAERGMAGATRALVAAGARGDQERLDGWLPLQLAASHGRTEDDGREISAPEDADYAETARALLRSAGADVSAAAPDGSTPIHLAVASDDVEVARLLLDNGADIESADEAGATPLSAALSSKQYDMADMLLKAGAVFSNGESIAQDAARGGDARMLRVALENGVAPDPRFYTTDASGEVADVLREFGVFEILYAETENGPTGTHMHHAARSGDLARVGALINHGAAAILEDDDGKTPLDYAVSGGHEAVAIALVNAGADSGGLSDQTLLEGLGLFGEGNFITLLDGGAVVDLSALNGDGESALHIAARRGFERLTRRLAEDAESGDFAAENANGQTPLAVARAEGSAALIRLLEEYSLDPNEVLNANGDTRLHVAARAGDAEEVRRWLAAGANPDSENNNGFRPLHVVSDSLHDPKVDAARALLEGGADPNARSGLNGGAGALQETPLHYAAKFSHFELVRLYLDAGADPLLGRYGGMNALDMARWGADNRGQEEGEQTIAILEEATAEAQGVADAAAAATEELHNAIDSNNADRVADALRDHETDAAGWLALMERAHGGSRGTKANSSLAVADAIAALGETDAADALNYQNRRGKTVLHLAAIRGQVARLRAFAGAGANLNLQDDDGKTALATAIERKRGNSANALLSLGAGWDSGEDALRGLSGGALRDLLLGEEDSPPTLLPDLTAFIVQVLGDPNDARSDGRQPLQAALEDGDEDRAYVLLALGAEVNAHGSDGRTPLMVAVETGLSLEMLAHLMERGADPTLRDSHRGFTPLHKAVSYSPDALQTMVEAGTDVNVRDGAGFTPLYWAADMEADAPRDGTREEVALTLLDLGADPTIGKNGGDGGYPLMVMVQTGMSAEGLRAVVEAGGEADRADSDRFSPLHAGTGRSAAVMEALLSGGANANALDGNGFTPLMWALNPEATLESGTVSDIVEALLDAGADPMIENNEGKTAIALAEENGMEAALETLQEAVAVANDPNTPDSDGRTPLQAALEDGNVDDIKSLLRRGADANTPGSDGRTPLLLAVEEFLPVEALRALVEAGADPAAQSSGRRKYTALHKAVAHSPEAIEALLERGADVNVLDGSGSTPLFWASNYEASPPHSGAREDVVLALLLRDADPNIAGRGERYPLMVMVRSGMPPEVLRAAVAAGAKADVWDRGRVAPLHMGARRSAAVVEALLSDYAQVDITDGAGATPLMWAMDSSAEFESGTRLDVVRLLLERGADPNFSDRRGKTVMRLAAEAEVGEEVLDALAQAGGIRTGQR